jgi:hypothetical protein
VRVVSHHTYIPYTYIQEQPQQEGPTFEAMLAAVLPMYKALLQAIAALGFPYVFMHVYMLCI